MSRSLNKVTLIGNLTRDPELRFTPNGAAVCSFGLATNRQWNTDTGERKEEVEFHRIVAWGKLAELCGQLLAKGRKVFVEGRLQTRKWTGQDSVERQTTEVVISDMIILDSRGQFEAGKPSSSSDVPDNLDEIVPPVDGGDDDAGSSKKTSSGNDKKSTSKSSKKDEKVEKNNEKEKSEEESAPDDDIPF